MSRFSPGMDLWSKSSYTASEVILRRAVEAPMEVPPMRLRVTWSNDEYERPVVCRPIPMRNTPTIIRYDWDGLARFWNTWDEAMVADRGPDGESAREALRKQAWLVWARLSDVEDWGIAGLAQAMSPVQARDIVLELAEGADKSRATLVRALRVISEGV